MDSWGKSLFPVCLALLWGTSFLVTAKKHDYPVKALTKDLLERYEKVGPGLPLINVQNALEVKFGLALQQILEVDMEAGTISTLVWYSYEWLDPVLIWNESDYDGVQSVRLKHTDIYTPDIIPYNGILGQTHFYGTDIVVYSTGVCSWVPVCLLTTSCSTPREKTQNHTCEIKFGSWTYDGTKVNLTSNSNEVDTSTYSKNQEWELLDAPAKREVKNYECCPEPYISITFSLILQHSGANILQSSVFLWLAPALLATYLLSNP